MYLTKLSRKYHQLKREGRLEQHRILVASSDSEKENENRPCGNIENYRTHISLSSESDDSVSVISVENLCHGQEDAAADDDDTKVVEPEKGSEKMKLTNEKFSSDDETSPEATSSRRPRTTSRKKTNCAAWKRLESTHIDHLDEVGLQNLSLITDDVSLAERSSSETFVTAPSSLPTGGTQEISFLSSIKPAVSHGQSGSQVNKRRSVLGRNEVILLSSDSDSSEDEEHGCSSQRSQRTKGRTMSPNGQNEVIVNRGPLITDYLSESKLASVNQWIVNSPFHARRRSGIRHEDIISPAPINRSGPSSRTEASSQRSSQTKFSDKLSSKFGGESQEFNKSSYRQRLALRPIPEEGQIRQKVRTTRMWDAESTSNRCSTEASNSEFRTCVERKSFGVQVSFEDSESSESDEVHEKKSVGLQVSMTSTSTVDKSLSIVDKSVENTLSDIVGQSHKRNSYGNILYMTDVDTQNTVPQNFVNSTVVPKSSQNSSAENDDLALIVSNEDESLSESGSSRTDNESNVASSENAFSRTRIPEKVLQNTDDLLLSSSEESILSEIVPEKKDDSNTDELLSSSQSYKELSGTRLSKPDTSVQNLFEGQQKSFRKHPVSFCSSDSSSQSENRSRLENRDQPNVKSGNDSSHSTQSRSVSHVSESSSGGSFERKSRKQTKTTSPTDGTDVVSTPIAPLSLSAKFVFTNATKSDEPAQTRNEPLAPETDSDSDMAAPAIRQSPFYSPFVTIRKRNSHVMTVLETPEADWSSILDEREQTPSSSGSAASRATASKSPTSSSFETSALPAISITPSQKQQTSSRTTPVPIGKSPPASTPTSSSTRSRPTGTPQSSRTPSGTPAVSTPHKTPRGVRSGSPFISQRTPGCPPDSQQRHGVGSSTSSRGPSGGTPRTPARISPRSTEPVRPELPGSVISPRMGGTPSSALNPRVIIPKLKLPPGLLNTPETRRTPRTPPKSTPKNSRLNPANPASPYFRFVTPKSGTVATPSTSQRKKPPRTPKSSAALTSPYHSPSEDGSAQAIRFEVSRTISAPSKEACKTLPVNVPGKLTFLASLSLDEPNDRCHPDAVAYVADYDRHKHELVARLYGLFNEKAFDSKLPQDLAITWNPRMTKTAGVCVQRRIQHLSTGTEERLSRIELSTKVLDCGDRLRDTLAHEMCHAASWILSGYRDGHGPVWKSWAKQVMQAFPELPIIARCHAYVIRTKYNYRCTNCFYQIGRHSKSVDIDKQRCGMCRGRFELLVNGKVVKKASEQTQGSHATSTPPNNFSNFVRNHYKNLRTPGRSHGDVMKALSERFAKTKLAPNTS